MDRKVHFTYKMTDNEKTRSVSISDILGKEIFSYLKNQGYLKDKDRSGKVNEVLENAKRILDKNQVSNLMEM